MHILQTIIHQFFTATDQQDWKTVESSFAPNVQLDYSSMTGLPAASITPTAIIESWKGILPGFDHTHHQVGNFIIKNSTEDTASVFCYGTATHYLDNKDGKLWVVVGSYDFDLEYHNNQWQITTMTFNFKYQSGNLNLPQLAIKRLNNTSLLSTSEQNKQAVRDFLHALETKNSDQLVELFAENGKHFNPYHSNIFPEGAIGKDAIRTYWSPVFSGFGGMQFPIQELYAMEDCPMVYVKFKGIIQRKDSSDDYKNDYFATFKFDETGKITEYIEIFNPITAAKGFNLLDNIK